MKPTLRRRFIEWVCKVFGHRRELNHIHAGNKHYVCKRCGATGVGSMGWQTMVVLERVEKNWKRKRRKENEKRY